MAKIGLASNLPETTALVIPGGMLLAGRAYKGPVQVIEPSLCGAKIGPFLALFDDKEKN